MLGESEFRLPDAALSWFRSKNLGTHFVRSLCDLSRDEVTDGDINLFSDVPKLMKKLYKTFASSIVKQYFLIF
jgi:hypothetical protein